MPPVKLGKKPNTGVPGVKLLITATSLAATVGGWALISTKETKPAPPPAAAQASAPQAAGPVFSIKLAPLPTLVPAVANQAQIVTVSNQRAASAPRPAAVAAQPAPQPALVLRDVSAPVLSSGGSTSSAGAPAPVANTGSSR